MLEKSLIKLNVDAKTSEEALKIMASEFVKVGVSKESFPNAILEREKKYPTALPAKYCDIAVPHTFAEHVNRPGIGVCVLSEPVAFQQMGSPEITLHPKVLFMLAITDPKDQIKLLQKILGMIQDDEALKTIVNAKSEDEIYEFIGSKLD